MNRLQRVIVGMVLITLVATMASAQSILFSTENRFFGDSTGSDDHIYRVRVRAGQMVEVIVRSETVDTYVEGVLPDGERIVNDDYEGLNAGFLHTMTVDGMLVFEAAPLFDEGTGPYEVLVREVGAAEPIGLGDSIQSDFDKTDVAAGDASHRYWFRGTHGQIVVIDLTSDAFDAYLRVQDDHGREFIDDDGGAGRNSRVTYTFDRDGILAIHASSFSGNGEGRYQLRVEEIGTDPVVTYQGELATGSERSYDGKWMDRYEYAGSSGETISIHLESDDFDPQLYLSGPSGESIAQDDDGGGGTDSLLTVTLPETGTYVIYALPFLNAGGRYQLSIYR